jgi:hypothetical protein
MLGVVAVVGMAFVLWKARLPVPLWYWDSRRPFRSRAWNVAFSVPIVVAALLTVDSMLFGMGVGVPAHLIVLYLLLSGRAIMVAKGGFLGGEFEAAIGYDPAKKAKESA